MRFARARLAAVVAVIAIVASGCYLEEVKQLRASGATEVPWYCNPTAPNSVTGPGMGTVNFYAGQTRSALDWDTCQSLAAQMDLAKQYAEQYPTLGDALADGFRTSFVFLPGMGTHTGSDAMTPELLADPSFNRFDPILPGITDSTFLAQEPEFLQFNGNGPTSRLVGMSWYVRSPNGQPPAGFPGNNDWWHHHPRLCFRSTDAIIIGVNNTDSACSANGGVNVYTQDYYMVHLWVVDDLEYERDVFAPTHPCILSSGAIFDMNNPCHQSAPGGGFSTAGAGGGSSTDPSSAFYCPLGSVKLPEP